MKNYSIYKIKTHSSFFKNYSYVIVDLTSKTAAIVDPAWELEKFLQCIESLQIHLSAILLTHHHTDHVNLAEPLARQFHIPVYIHRTEADQYYPKAERSIPLSDGDQIQLGQTIIDCLHTPGHTAGSVCYVLPDCIFTGDTVFIEGCGACDTFEHAEDMFTSIEKIKSRLQPDVRVYPGHSYGKEPGYPLRYLLENNIYFQLNRDQFIRFRMRKNQKNLHDFQ